MLEKCSKKKKKKNDKIELESRKFFQIRKKDIIRNKKMIMVLAITLMAIGFAAVSTTLILNGQTYVASNQADFDVYFSKAVENEVENNTLIQDKTHLAFETELTGLDETYILDYEVTNASKNYDANLTMNCVGGNEYIRVENNFDISKPLLSKEKRTGKLTLTVIQVPLEEVSVSISCEIKGNAVERTESGNSGTTGDNYQESTLNGTDPVLKNGLIPVMIANDGTVTYADTNNKWYDYENKEWANAVILSEGKTHTVGDVIPEDDIESYFVWIPKYKYQIFDMGNYSGSTSIENKAQEIQIEFTLDETTDTDTSCVSPKAAGESGTCSVGKWMTHPAFQNFGVAGLWVGKFETGYKGATSYTDAQKTEINDMSDNKIIVKPNVYSWRANIVGNFFKSFYNYKRDLDSHMMKNTEWGAVAYLSHSKYGINTEVRINNNSNFLTGYAAKENNASSSTTNNEPYNTAVGVLASTTGNITGVYDMSGGSLELMAASRGAGRSGLTTEELITYAQYIDTYPTSGGATTYINRILGDATGEMGPFSDSRNSWYGDSSYFVDSSYPWFGRGSNYGSGSGAGQFCFGRSTGEMGICSRLVLAVK